MKICRYEYNDEISFGVVNNKYVDPLDNFHFSQDSVIPTKSGQTIKSKDIKFLPPVSPSKIVCVGRNYAEHAAELGNDVPKEPLLFLKAPSAVVTDGESILLPHQSIQVEHEGELAVVIGRKCKKFIKC